MHINSHSHKSFLRLTAYGFLMNIIRFIGASSYPLNSEVIVFFLHQQIKYASVFFRVF